MDKQMIEEMAEIMDIDCGECYTCEYYESKGINCTCLLQARELYNAGYRKIPECSVVLTKEEYDRLKQEKRLAHDTAKGYSLTDIEQKAEIERLTREYERITYNKQEYLEWVDGFLRTHTVMKDRGEDYKMFDREWMCNTFWAKIESSLDYIIDLENQRNELQKQVDELKSENTELYKEHTTLIAGSILQKQNIVKDTAKEILQELADFVDFETFREGYELIKVKRKIKEIAKEKGVEVE